MGDRARLQADEQCVRGHGVPELREEMARRHAQEDRRNREGEERKCERGRGDERGGERLPSHRSIRTEVALTSAVAGMPTSSPSDSAASRVITETTRKGPASSST